MTRQAIWLTVAVLAALTLGTAWFLTNFERVTVTRHEAAKPEARRNPYLALERFLARMGRPMQTIGNARGLDEIDAGVLILDRNRRRQLDERRIGRLLAWVEAGGYLIANAERGEVDDPLLERLGVSWRPFGAAECGPGQDASGAAADDEAEDAGPPAVSAELPVASRPLTVELPFVGLQASDRQPAWSVERPGRGGALLHFGYGSGQITVLADLHQIAGNRSIGRADHAEVLWSLLQHYRPDGRVLLATRLAVPTLGEWLVESASMVLLSGALLLAAWLGRVVPRFGGLAPLPPVERRSLAAHLAAMGRFVAGAGGLAHWLAAVRGALQARLALRHPGIATLPPGEQARALARLARLPEGELRHALSGSAGSHSAFRNRIATLQKLEHLL